MHSGGAADGSRRSGEGLVDDPLGGLSGPRRGVVLFGFLLSLALMIAALLAMSHGPVDPTAKLDVVTLAVGLLTAGSFLVADVTAWLRFLWTAGSLRGVRHAWLLASNVFAWVLVVSFFATSGATRHYRRTHLWELAVPFWLMLLCFVVFCVLDCVASSRRMSDSYDADAAAGGVPPVPVGDGGRATALRRRPGGADASARPGGYECRDREDNE